MLFSSSVFLFAFLPAVLLVYYLPLRRWRLGQNLFLLLASLFFYGWGAGRALLLMVVSILMNHLLGLWAGRARERSRSVRPAVTLAVICNLSLLFVFKYLGFTVSVLQNLGIPLPAVSITLPIGISFFTFQAMSYVLDVARGRGQAQKSLLNVGLYISFFPQLIAGPIIKYKDLGDQIDHRTHSPEQFASGVQIFVVGLAKKVLLANNIGKLWDTILALPAGELTTAGAWLGVAAFAFQLYFDFSGYSDMAVGLGRMLGFEFMRNFNYPYIAKSVTEFWRRWHISLGTWFREYLYIPLGGNRVSKPRLFFNLLVVWAATGIWHGASWNFLIWGLYFAVLLILEKAFLGKLLQKLPAALQHLYTLFLVLVSWAIFAVEDFGHMGAYLKAMFGLGGGLTNDNVSYYFFSFLHYFLQKAFEVSVKSEKSGKITKRRSAACRSGTLSGSRRQS
ncbi:MBOAT family O-acyltransferase [Hominenteromicrobium sp.]|uniref:MBOAT family O-acyltransferase n=1 Tax=Hominenteromicrobium sp. TaxID=3073581 RepID=UPI003AF03F2A